MGKGKAAKKKGNQAISYKKALNEEKKTREKNSPVSKKAEAAAAAARAEATQTRRGCLVPFLKHGCLEGQAIPAGALKPPQGAVRIKCMLTATRRNEACPGVPWLHGRCYDSMEERLADECIRSYPRCRAWSKKFARENLWKQGKGLDLIFHLLRCPAPECTGYIVPDAEWQETKPKLVPIARPVAPNNPAPAAAPVQPKKKEAKPKLNHHTWAKFGAAGPFKYVQGRGASDVTRAAEFTDKIARIQARAAAEADARAAEEAAERSAWLPPGAAGWKRDVEEDEPPQPPTPAEPPARSEFPDFGFGTAGVGSGAVPQGAWGFAATQDLVQPPKTTDEGMRLAQELRTLAAMNGGTIWEGNPQVEDTLRKVSAELMGTIADIGGFEAWLEALDMDIVLSHGKYIHRGMAPTKPILRNTGVVISIVDPSCYDAVEVIVDAEAVQTKVLFDRGSILLNSEGRQDRRSRLRQGDWLSFKAEEVGSGPEDRLARSLALKWKIVEAELIQRADDDTVHEARPPPLHHLARQPLLPQAEPEPEEEEEEEEEEKEEEDEDEEDSESILQMMAELDCDDDEAWAESPSFERAPVQEPVRLHSAQPAANLPRPAPYLSIRVSPPTQAVRAPLPSQTAPAPAPVRTQPAQPAPESYSRTSSGASSGTGADRETLLKLLKGQGSVRPAGPETAKPPPSSTTISFMASAMKGARAQAGQNNSFRAPGPPIPRCQFRFAQAPKGALEALRAAQSSQATNSSASSSSNVSQDPLPVSIAGPRPPILRPSLPNAPTFSTARFPAPLSQGGPRGVALYGARAPIGVHARHTRPLAAVPPGTGAPHTPSSTPSPPSQDDLFGRGRPNHIPLPLVPQSQTTG